MVGTKKITSFEDLDVYKRLTELHLEVHRMTMNFPNYEMYELGSQLRRSSNSIPANLAEGWNNKHSTIYLESINRALGELRETSHHLAMAFRKEHITKDAYESLRDRYDECGRMLRSLGRSLERSLSSRTSESE